MIETTAPFTAIKPITITDSILTSHTESETESDWEDSPTSYDTGERVKHGVLHDAFSSLADSNEGNEPVKWPDNTSYWYDEGKTNPHNMFDLTTNFDTVGTSPMTVVLEPGEPVTGIMIRPQCDEVLIEVSDGVSTVYSRTVKTIKRDVTGWYTFFTAKHRFQRIFSLYDLPGLVENPVITITFTSASGTVRCSALLIGPTRVIGSAQNSGCSHRRNGFSLFEVDEIDAERFRLLKRGAIRELTIKAYVMKRDLDWINNFLDEVDGIPVSWSCVQSLSDSWYETFSILGAYKSPVNIRPIDGTDQAYIDINVQGF